MANDNDIAERAYHLWINRGQSHGSHEDDWHEAERQLRSGTGSEATSQDVDKALEETFPASDPPASHLPDVPPSNAAAKWKAAGTHDRGEITLQRHGRQYGATYSVTHGMMEVKTHTETRSIKLDGRDPVELARQVLDEIVEAQPKKR